MDGGGGGGGAGGAGGAPISRAGGNGGDGIDLSGLMAFGLDRATFGVGVDGWFGGGGGGVAGVGSGGAGGRGGGGDGTERVQGIYGSPGVPNSGGGGGGGISRGGRGGDGAVIVRYAVSAAEVPYVDTESVELADPLTGSQRFTSSNEVVVTGLTVPDGYDLYQITATPGTEGLGANWLGTDSMPSILSFERPLEDTTMEWYLWFTNSNAEVKLQRSQGTIYYTEAAPEMALRPVTRYIVPGEMATVKLSDFLAPGGGQADGRMLDVVSIAIAAKSAGLDLTPEDPECVTLGTPGVHPLEIRVMNEVGVERVFAVDANIRTIAADEQLLFGDRFSTGGWADSDSIPGFWTRTKSSILAEEFFNTIDGRLIWYIEFPSGNKSYTLRSANNEMFDFSERKLRIRMVDIQNILPTYCPTGVYIDWRYSIGFSKTPGQRIDQSSADSVHMALMFRKTNFVIDLFNGTTKIGTRTISGYGETIASNHNDIPLPCNVALTIGPSDASLVVELTDGTEVALSGAHSFDSVNDPWITAPSLNMYYFSGSSLGIDNPQGFSMDSVFVTTPRAGTLILLR